MLWRLETILPLSFFFFSFGITCAQTTVVTPVLTLNAPGINDQDDMCIWISADATQSTIITSDKTAKKIFVYDLDGNVLQTISVSGKPGNIDIQYHFILSGVPTDIVGYNDRDNEAIVFYKIDPTSRQLSIVGSFDDGHLTNSNYGFCLYHSPNNGKYYAIASSNSTQMRQWELIDNGDGTIGGILKRTWNNGTGDITEGLVADDETGKLYCANEGEGIYKYDADPTDPNPTGELIALTGENSLTSDVEGITIYYAANGEGYLIVSSQGSDNFKVYERKEPHNFVKTFKVEGVSNTDGIEVTNVSLGTNFPQGLFLTHNGSGSGPYSINGSRYEDLGLIDPLPVELTYFLAISNRQEVELKWKTETEVNNFGFEIEKRLFEDFDQQNAWNKIGFVQGHGNSNSPKEYTFIDKQLEGGSKFQYRLKQIDNDGQFEYSDIIEVEVIPYKYDLSQNYPNPFNPSTKIKYQIPDINFVTLKVYDVLGNEIETLVDEEKQIGYHNIEFNASTLSSGVYFYRLQAGNYIETKKMVLLP
jgi:3-phytase